MGADSWAVTADWRRRRRRPWRGGAPHNSVKPLGVTSSVLTSSTVTPLNTLVTSLNTSPSPLASLLDTSAQTYSLCRNKVSKLFS